jgi:hypothetical protein
MHMYSKSYGFKVKQIKCCEFFSEFSYLGCSMNFFFVVMLLFPFICTNNLEYTWSDNKVRELATVCLPWQQWIETSV